MMASDGERGADDTAFTTVATVRVVANAGRRSLYRIADNYEGIRPHIG
jgi:hypothetical protein